VDDTLKRQWNPEKLELDSIDFALLEALQDDARLSNKELAAKVGLAPSSCLSRVARLLKSGVLRSFHAEVDVRALGVGLQALIAVRLRQHSQELVSQFRQHLLSFPEVLAVYQVTGPNDFFVHVAVRDVDHLRNVSIEAFTARSEMDHMETALIFEHVRNPRLPRYAQGAPSSPLSPQQ